MIYGYVRVSTKVQKIERQIENILKDYPKAKIVQEVGTGTSLENRNEWKKLKKKLKPGDTVVFDSVSRMSRNADEGIKLYMELYNNDIELIFLKEQYISTTTYKEQIGANQTVKVDDKDINDTIMDGIRKYLMLLAEKQIRIAFEQSEKEVKDLQQRTKEGLIQAKIKGKQVGRIPGKKYTTEKERVNKEIILKHSKAFGGTLKDVDVISLTGINRNTYYKYKKELLENWNL